MASCDTPETSKLENLGNKWDAWKQRRAINKYCKHLDDQASKPRPSMPRIRKSLNLPLASSTDGGLGSRTTYDQAKSFLLGRLMIEIRLQIYREVLDDQCFHIIRRCARLGHLRCQAEDLRDGCWCIENDDGTIYKRYRDF